MTTPISTTEDLLQALDDNPTFYQLARAKILGDDLLQLPARFEAFVDQVETFIAKQEQFNERQEQFNERQEQFNERSDRRTTRIQNDISQLRGAYASQTAQRLCGVIAFTLGLEWSRNLTPTDLVTMVSRANRSDSPHNELMSFFEADLIMEAVNEAGELRYIAVEASYTGDMRDVNRVLRNARYLREFTGADAIPIIASVRNDNDARNAIDQGQVRWHQLALKDTEPE